MYGEKVKIKVKVKFGYVSRRQLSQLICVWNYLTPVLLVGTRKVAKNASAK
jgi:hypothetical protein